MEYWVERIISSKETISGKLFSVDNKVVFETYGEHEGRLEIPIARVTDVRFATEKDISALRVWLVGPVLGTFWKKKRNILLFDFEDEFGIIQHLAFEGRNDLENAEKELYQMRKTEKLNRRKDGFQN
jgi:hypothetical protein